MFLPSISIYVEVINHHQQKFNESIAFNNKNAVHFDFTHETMELVQSEVEELYIYFSSVKLPTQQGYKIISSYSFIMQRNNSYGTKAKF